MSDEVALVPLAATSVRYRYVSVHRIVGFSALADGRNLVLNLSLPDTSAYLTADPNASLAEVDHGTAVADLIFRAAFRGQARDGSYLETVQNRGKQLAQERAKQLGSTGVYFVLETRGNLQTVGTEVARDLGGAVLAFDAVNKAAIVADHQPLVSAALSALSIIVDTSSDIIKVTDGISFELPDGRPLYSVTMTANSARVTVARPATQADASKIEDAVGKFLADQRLATPSRLFVDTMRRTEDRLEAFIFAWAALEMVIKKFTVNCETGDWVNTATGDNRTAAKRLHQEFLDSKHKFYSLVMRSHAFCLIHNVAGVDELANEISGIRKNIREPLFHEGKLVEQTLPVEAVSALVRRLLTAALDSARLSETA